MYCVNCGVQLGESQRRCPVCQMQVVVPEGTVLTGKPLYPQTSHPVQEERGKTLPVLMSILCAMAITVVLLCDGANGKLSWCGYAIGGLLTAYVGLVLPTWFRRPNPVIFTPCFFAAVVLYLLYIDLAVGGRWFLGFAFPVAGGIGLIVTALVTLLRYVRRGKLFSVGGALMGLGAFTPVAELLMCVTFPGCTFSGWSLYPLGALALLGGFLIFLGICRPARETMKRKFFC